MQNTNEIIPFAFGDNLVRTVLDESGNPWWVAKDVAEVLGYRMASDMTRNLDDDEKGTHFIRTLGGEQEVLIINEPGLYSSIMRSNKPEAREFRRWVTHEVLPALRRTGRYTHPAAEAAERPSLDFASLPADVRSLKPRVRERCMDLALQSVRLSGLSSPDDQYAAFIDFCRALGTPPESPRGAVDQKIAAYARGRLVARPGGCLQSSVVYGDFRRWWRENNVEKYAPSVKAFITAMDGLGYSRRKRSAVYFLDVAFAQSH